MSRDEPRGRYEGPEVVRRRRTRRGKPEDRPAVSKGLRLENRVKEAKAAARSVSTLGRSSFTSVTLPAPRPSHLRLPLRPKDV